MKKLSISVLSADFAKLGEEIKLFEKTKVPYIHYDVMDGHFVPNISMGIPVLESIRKCTNLVVDAHLMISEPEKYIEAFAKAGADIINFHIEATKNPLELIEKIHLLNKKAALTIKPNTPVEDVLEYLKYIDMVLVMSVEPGFAGQKFIPQSLEKVKKIRKYIDENNLKCEIEIDGGICYENLSLVIDAGVDVVVIGSAIFKGNKEENMIKYVKYLSEK